MIRVRLRNALFVFLAFQLLFFYFPGKINVQAAKEESKVVNYTCDVLGALKVKMKVKITGTVPESVLPNSEFTLENSYTEVTFDDPSSLDLLKSTANPLKGQVTGFHLLLENAADLNGKTDVNVADPPIDIPVTPIPADADSVSFRVPETGGKNVSLKAGESGKVVIKAGQITTNLVTVLGTIPSVCTPDAEQDLTVNEIPIEAPDTTPPVITLIGDNPLYLNVGDEFVDPGATATDDVDGDLTEQIVVTGSVDTSKPGEYILTYTVSDSAGNEATETRTVIVREAQEPDTTPPVITLKGDNPLHLYVGDEFVDPGATATDDVDGDLTEQIVVTGSVDTSKPGEYTLTYTVSDSAGNTASVTRTVIVQEKEEEQPPAGGIWYYGEGAPDEDLGSTGDLYLDIASGDVYVKQENGWVLAFNMIGGDGSKIFTGTGAPAAELGKAGDYYLDTSAYDLYLKDESGWKLIGNLKGAKGDDGTSWHVGEGKPDSSLGRPGDFYIDAKTGDLYIKDSENGWVFLLSLKGSDEPGGGNPGDDEPQGGNDDEQNNGGPSNGNTGNGGSGGADNGQNQGGSGNPLPDTATKEPLLLSLGLLLTLLGGAGWLFRRRIFQ
jgi:LPXTG-motif cell wall-anchored protein